MTISRLAGVDRDSPVVWDPTGNRIAFSHGEVRVLAANSGTDTTLAGGTATALAWSPDGTKLAGAFPEGTESVVKIFDRTGTAQEGFRAPGRIGRMLWKQDGELLATAVELRAFSFGGGVTQRLYRWNGTDTPTVTTLGDTTVKRTTLQHWRAELPRTASLALSPLQDEISFTRLIDPPMYEPYLRIVLRNLTTGAERESASVPFPSAGAVFTPDGEQLLTADGSDHGRRFDPWGDDPAPTLPGAPQEITLSPGGSTMFKGGRLTRGDTLLATFPAESRGYFSPTGDRLLIAQGGALYLLSGLPADHPRPLPAETRDRLVFLHKLRSERLITIQDYRSQKERIPKQ
jgi:hypothetical protein